MGLIAIETQSKGIRWTDGRTIGTAKSLGELLGQLDRPHAVFCEPAFYDDLRDVRRHLEEWLGERGHRLMPITDAVKDTLQAAGGERISGRGVVRLLSLATDGTGHLGRASGDQDLNELRGAIQVAHVVDLFDERRDALEEALAAVGPYASLAEPARAALGDGSAYRVDVLLAAYRAAGVATNRDAFERLLGLNAGAHGPLTQTVRAWYVERNTTETFVRESALTWADYRRALRNLFHRMTAQRRTRVAA